MTGVERMNRYINDVLEHKIQTNLYIQQACKRHLNDLQRSQTDSDFPYIFDETKANRFIDFAEHLKQFEDKWRGTPLHYEDWQCFIFCSIYGWVYKDTGYRRFRKAFLFVGRKNGKSHMCAASLLYDALTTNGAQCLCCATKLDQARIVWNVAQQMIRQNKALADIFRIYGSTSRLINEKKNSYIAALASDATRADGLSPSLIVADEVAAMKDYGIIKTLMSGAGARPESLCLEITSGSDNMESPGYSEFQLSKEILTGIKQDETFFCMLYCIDQNDAWTNPNLLAKANPNIGISISEDWLRKQLQEAMNNPRLEGEFRCKNLNQWLNPLTAWIKPKDWSYIMDNANTYKFNPEKPFYAVGAVDLSQRRDLTAFTVCLYQNNHFFMEHHMYFPEDAIQDKLAHSSDLWRVWMDKGYVTPTPGNSINYEYMYQDIRDAMKKYNLEAILYDPYNSASMVNELDGDCNLIECGQNMKNLSPYTKAYEEEIYNKNIVDDNPVLQWMHFHAEIYTDPSGNIKIVKGKDEEKKIDALITSVMSLGYIRTQIDEGELDLRTPEEIGKSTEEFLKNLFG